MTQLECRPRQEYRPLGRGWCRTIILGGCPFLVGLVPGRRARVAFRPKGRKKRWLWRGFVRTLDGRELWAGVLRKPLGVQGLLVVAEILPRG